MDLSKTHIVNVLQKCTQHKLNSKQESLSLLIYSIFLITGFRLIGLEEDSLLERPRDLNDACLPDHWNASKDHFDFKFKHDQSSLTFLVKCLKLADKFIVHGYAIEEGKVHEFDIHMDSFINSQLSFPLEGFSDIFIHLDDLVSDVKSKILHKLIPGLTKIGYEPTIPTTTTQPPPTVPYQPPFRPFIPQNPVYPEMPPYVNDPFGRSPFTIGDADLDPFAAMRPPQY